MQASGDQLRSSCQGNSTPGNRPRLRWALALGCVALGMLALAVYGFTPPAFPKAPSSPANLRLATWLGVSWSMVAPDQARVRGLAQALTASRIDDVYVFVSYLAQNDEFNPTFDFAAEFVAALKQFAPELRILAWIGIPVSVAGSDVANRLQSAEIRNSIARFSHFAVAGLGFDGVHINAELVADGDPAFLATSAAIREALPGGAFFSATAHPLRLEETVTLMPYPAVAHHWSASYLARVAEAVDQLVLMAYDSGLVFPRDYVNWVRYQVRRSQAALRDQAAEFMIGISVSDEWTVSHQTQAESFTFALAGIEAGAADRLDGVAIYPYWEAEKRHFKLIADNRKS